MLDEMRCVPSQHIYIYIYITQQCPSILPLPHTHPIKLSGLNPFYDFQWPHDFHQVFNCPCSHLWLLKDPPDKMHNVTRMAERNRSKEPKPALKEPESCWTRLQLNGNPRKFPRILASGTDQLTDLGLDDDDDLVKFVPCHKP